MNTTRAVWANQALEFFGELTGAKDLANEALPDLLTNMHHWCDYNGVNFNAILAQTHRTYAEETRPEHDEPPASFLDVLLSMPGACRGR